MAHIHKEKYHKAVKLEFLEAVHLELTFEDGLVKHFDMSSLFDDYPQYRVLKDRALFEAGQLFSFVIVWNDMLDIETEEIYDCGTTVRRERPLEGASAGSVVAFTRLTRKLSQTALAERVGMDQADISKIERGIANPSVKTLRRIADALDCKLVIHFKPKDPDDPAF